MDTRNDDKLDGRTWVTLSTLGIPVGKATSIQNVSRSTTPVRIWIGPAKPADNFVGGRRLLVNAVADIAAGEGEIHLYAEEMAGEVNIEFKP